jgi:spermidine synthase
LRIDFERIDSQRTDLGILSLHRYVAETGETGYEVRIDGAFLMATHGAWGEIAMVALARARIDGGVEGLQVLVGGLGAGHTLGAALDRSDVAFVEVVEISSKVVDWNRRYFTNVHPHGVDDPRVAVVCADLGQVLRERRERYHMILIDVDNGPGWLAAAANRDLYGPSGLAACREALVPGGVAAYWSPQPNSVLRCELDRVFGNVEQVDTASLAPQAAGPSDVVLLATRR